MDSAFKRCLEEQFVTSALTSEIEVYWPGRHGRLMPVFVGIIDYGNGYYSSICTSKEDFGGAQRLFKIEHLVKDEFGFYQSLRQHDPRDIVFATGRDAVVEKLKNMKTMTSGMPRHENADVALDNLSRAPIAYSSIPFVNKLSSEISQADWFIKTYLELAGDHYVRWFDFGHGRYGLVRTKARDEKGDVVLGDRPFELEYCEINRVGKFTKPMNTKFKNYDLLRARMDEVYERYSAREEKYVALKEKLPSPIVPYGDLVTWEGGLVRGAVTPRPVANLVLAPGR